MFVKLFESIASNPWVLAVGTVAFFTIKGLLWLLIPALALRFRNRFRRSKQPINEAIQVVE